MVTFERKSIWRRNRKKNYVNYVVKLRPDSLMVSLIRKIRSGETQMDLCGMVMYALIATEIAVKNDNVLNEKSN